MDALRINFGTKKRARKEREHRGSWRYQAGGETRGEVTRQQVQLFLGSIKCLEIYPITLRRLHYHLHSNSWRLVSDESVSLMVVVEGWIQSEVS